MSISKELEVPSFTPEKGVGDTYVISNATLAEVGVDEEAAKKDRALALLAGRHGTFDPNSPEAKAVIRKIDRRILPLLFVIYTLMLMDKSSLSFAAIMGIKKDCHLTGSQYSWLGSLVYIGYLAGEIPATIIMQRLPLAKVFSIVCIIWGIIVAMHAACSNFASLAALRFLLGFLEVYTAPCIIYIMGSWYTKEEQVTRLSIWYTCYGAANMFGGFFAWAVYQADSFRWQGLFVLFGSITFTVGCVMFLVLAATPTEASWLTEDEKMIGLERVRNNKTGTEVWRFNSAQLREAFLDPRFYLIFTLLVATGLPTGGFTVFGPSIISGFGFTTDQSTLLSIGSGAACSVFVGLAWMVAKYTNRTIAGVFTLVVSCIGVVLMLAIPAANYGARYGGYVLALQFPNCIPFVITFMTAGVGGSTKKFAFSAAYQLGYSVGNIIGPQTYRAHDAPTYYPAKYTMLAFLILGFIVLGAIGVIHMFWNRKRDKQDEIDAQNGVVHVRVENEEFADLTDFQLGSFRYPV